MGIGVTSFGSNQTRIYDFSSAPNTSQSKSFTQASPPSGSPYTDFKLGNNTDGIAYVKWGRSAQTAVADETCNAWVMPGAIEIMRVPPGTTDFGIITDGVTGGKVLLSSGEGS